MSKNKHETLRKVVITVIVAMLVLSMLAYYVLTFLIPTT